MPAAHEHDLVVVDPGGEMRALRARLDQEIIDLPDGLKPVRHAAIYTDEAEEGR